MKLPEQYKTPIVCPLCDQEAHTAGPPQAPFRAHYECPRCGYFIVEQHGMFDASQVPDRHLLSGCTREYWEKHGEPLTIPTNTQELAQVLKRAPRDRDVAEKGKRLLLALERMTNYSGENIGCDRNHDYTLGYCRNYQELSYLFNYLEAKGIVQSSRIPGADWGGHISPAGWIEIESYGRPNAESDRVFVAMWFDEGLKSAYTSAIEPALAEDCGYNPVRIDVKEFVGDVVDEILAEIRESRFVVADVTGQRAGVYYEAGFALGLGLPVVWSCREDEIGKVHFDTRQQNHIVWNTPEELRQRLANRVRAVIGLGPHKGV